MTRTYGRSERGTRLLDKTPCGRWQTTTFLGTLRSDGFVAPLTVEGGIDGELFRAWVEQHLTPLLRVGDIVVMDNLSSHKVAGIRQAIEAVGAELRYLLLRRTSTLSSWPFPSSRSCSATEPNEPSTNSGISAAPSSISSPRPSAATTSNTADTATPKMKPL